MPDAPSDEDAHIMSKTGFNKSLTAFRALSEGSPLEAPIRGFNRYDRDMSPDTREMVLRSRMPEILAFSEDRRLDPAVVAGVVEASMRLGRIPDLGMYGLAGDEAIAVKDFVAHSMLGLESQLSSGMPLSESHEESQKHRDYADHYRKLADHHKQKIDWHTQQASEANKAGKPFTAARHLAKIAMLKQLHGSHAALADYHDCEAERHAKAAGGHPQQQQPRPNYPKPDAPLPQGAGPTHVQQPSGQPAHQVEQTTANLLSPIMKMPSAFMRRPGPGVNWGPQDDEDEDETPTPFKKRVGADAFESRMRGGDEEGPDVSVRKEAFGESKIKLPPAFLKNIKSKANGPERRGRELEPEDDQKVESGLFADLIDGPLSESRRGSTVLFNLHEAKKAKKKGKKKKGKGGKETADKALSPSNPDEVDKTLANVKAAPLFQALGHKMDHAEAKEKARKKVGTEWATKLHRLCLSKGGAAASDEVLKGSLTDPWIHDMGFVDEAANLRRKWETLMSAETQERAVTDSPTTPEPLVFAINRMIDMASGKGSIY